MQLSCLYKTNATVTAIVSQFHKFDASNEVKCFIDCYLGYKNITESEKIIPNGLRKAYNDTLKPEVIKRYEDRCEKWLGIRHKETKCHFAWRVARCYRFRFKDIRPPNRRKSY
ncbi:hypothetical protein KR059_005287 [Drosophila kikkawai]|nr:hypothetical protein KR059_005287 [Drosophila kikkawai]